MSYSWHYLWGNNKFLFESDNTNTSAVQNRHLYMTRTSRTACVDIVVLSDISVAEIRYLHNGLLRR